MKNNIEQKKSSGRNPYVKPELTVLDVKDTQTGPTLDINEFNPLIGPTS